MVVTLRGTIPTAALSSFMRIRPADCRASSTRNRASDSPAAVIRAWRSACWHWSRCPSASCAGSTDQAIVRGIGRTGRLVTSAALILFLAFLALSATPETASAGGQPAVITK